MYPISSLSLSLSLLSYTLIRTILGCKFTKERKLNDSNMNRDIDIYTFNTTIQHISEYAHTESSITSF